MSLRDANPRHSPTQLQLLWHVVIAKKPRTPLDCINEHHTPRLGAAHEGDDLW